MSRPVSLALLVFGICAFPASAILDTNQNGISDLWEMQYSGGTLPNPEFDPQDDPDADAWTNEQEAAAGTSPFDANAPDGIVRPQITHIPEVPGVTPEAVIISWPTIPGKQYTLLYSPDLAEWLPVPDETFIGSGSVVEYNFTLPPDDKLFWRVKVEDFDSDGDWLTDAEEAELHTDPNNPQTVAGYPDLWLATHFLATLRNGGPSWFDSDGDPDHDGLTNLEEYQNGTAPNNSDSDGDGITDGGEVDQDTDPNDAEDTPDAEWLILTGDSEMGVEKARSRTVTIPAGQRRLVVVATASAEFPRYTSTESPFNDILSWDVEPSDGDPISDTIDVNSRHGAWETDVTNGSSLQGFSPAHIESSQIYTAPQEGPLTVEIELSATNISDGILPSTVMVGFMPLDLAVDSDNNDGLNPPSRNGEEDEREDYETAQTSPNVNPGKFIKLNFGDYDNDGIPDFADGMDIYDGHGAEKSAKFVPMIANLSGICSITNAKVKFIYTEASPANIIEETVPNDISKWSPGNGDIRLWKKNGNEARLTADIKSEGDFVKANTEYSVADLSPDDQGLLPLYVEAVRKSNEAADIPVVMKVMLDGQNWIETDKVRFTANPRVIYSSPYDQITPLPGTMIKVAFEDETDASDQSLGGTVSGSNNDTLSVGHYGPHPDAENDETKDRLRLVIRLQTGVDTYTNGEDSIVLLVAEGISQEETQIAQISQNLSASQIASLQALNTANEFSINDNWSEDWEAQFERILFEKYEGANPRIEDLERDAFELWGWLYGGRSWAWFSARNVWRDGNKIFVEDSLTPEQAADAYYGFLVRALPTEAQGVNLTPIIRYYGELYELGGEDRSKVGQFMAKHWDLVETTANMLESDYLFVPASFALDGVLQIRRVHNMTFFTEGKVFAVPLVRRNWARGNITEHDTLVNSLGFTRNAGENSVRLTADVSGELIECIPDAIRTHWIIEVKDWKSLSATRQIRAEFSAAQNAQQNVCLIITGRTRKLSQPLMQLIEQNGGMLLRRNVNTDGYEIWNWQSSGWETIDKETVISSLP